MNTRLKLVTLVFALLSISGLQAMLYRPINPILVPLIHRRIVRVTPLMRPIYPLVYPVAPYFYPIRPVLQAGLLLPRLGINLGVRL